MLYISMRRRLAAIVLSIGTLTAIDSLAGCYQNGRADLEKEGHMPEKTIEQVQEEHTDDWMAIPGVEGTAIGLFENKPCIKIFSSRKAEELRAKIPSSVEGYPVIIEETGAFRALD
jgi:hypothetical protein